MHSASIMLGCFTCADARQCQFVCPSSVAGELYGTNSCLDSISQKYLTTQLIFYGWLHFL